jgi:diguanylate cyclase (GGDEF)-like protein
VDIEELSEVIARDPGLAVKMLKLANSPLFNMDGEVSTIRAASMVIGIRSVSLLALSFSLVDSLEADRPWADFDYDNFWRRSLTCAAMARRFSERARQTKLSDEAFLCGLISHIGGLAIGQCLPHEYAKYDVVGTSKDTNWPTDEKETEVLGFSQSDVLLALLGTWGLPNRICTATGFMQRPRSMPEDSETETRELTAIMTLSFLATRLICDPQKHNNLRVLEKWAASRYGIPKQELGEILVSVEEDIDNLADLLQLELPEGESHKSIMRKARSQLLQQSIANATSLSRAQNKTKALHKENLELELRASTDELTGLPNRRALDHHLAKEVKQRLSRTVPLHLGVLMIDIDHFKLFNDTHGHLAGDSVLSTVGALLLESVRAGDTAARFGGEEFAVIMPLASIDGMRICAERIRSRIEEAKLIWNGQELRITVSIGCSQLKRANSHLDGERLLGNADKLLYKAKGNGRNRVEM